MESPRGPQSCFLIPRTLDTGTHCLKVLFVSPLGRLSLFDHFYSFVIMGCNGLGCLNVRVITFHCSYPNPSKRAGWGNKKISREGRLCPSLMLFQAGLGPGSHSGDEKHEALAAQRIPESQFCGSRVTSHPLAKFWTLRLAVGVPLLSPWGCSHTLA